MTVDVQFTELSQEINMDFGELSEVSDGGYDKGYTEGYDKGVENGYNTGYTEGETKGKEIGIETGRTQEWSEFWDIYQNNGNRTDYVSAFRGSGWTKETFKPKHDITPKGGASMSYEMFHSSNIKGDLSEILNECGVQIKWGSKTYFSLEFAYSAFTKIKIDVAPSTYSSTFRDSTNLTDLEIKSNSNTTYTSAFYNCTALVNLIINGFLGKTVSFAQSPLSKTSIVGVFDIMSATVTGQTVTFNKAAVDKAFETSEGANDGSTSEEWNTLVASKSNWSIALG